MSFSLIKPRQDKETAERKKLLHQDLDKEDFVDWIAIFIVTILNVALWGWYFYYLHESASYIWMVG